MGIRITSLSPGSKSFAAQSLNNPSLVSFAFLLGLRDELKLTSHMSYTIELHNQPKGHSDCIAVRWA